MSPTIFISTGEASGDLHGAKVATAMIQQRSECRIVGMGGTAMRQAGVEIIVDNADLGVVGLWEVVAHSMAVWKAYRSVRAWLTQHRPDIVVLIDYPEFHFQIARLAKRLGLRVVYYISPQVWAWRSGRLQTLTQLVDQMIVILPFEVELYRSVGLPCERVSHPLLDEVSLAPDRSAIRQTWGVAPSQMLIGLFPGSRRAELKRHLPVMLEAAERIYQEHPDVAFLVCVAPVFGERELPALLRQTSAPITVKFGEPTATLAAVDAAMVVSGTMTLHAALLQVPMVIIYKAAPLTFLVARWLVRVPFIGLPNLIAGEAVVPELLQEQATPAAMADHILGWLTDPEQLSRLQKRLAVIRGRLGQPGGSSEAASIILRWLEPIQTPCKDVA